MSKKEENEEQIFQLQVQKTIFMNMEQGLQSCIIKAFLTFLLQLLKQWDESMEVFLTSSLTSPRSVHMNWQLQEKPLPYLGHKRTVWQHNTQYKGMRSQLGDGGRERMKKLNRGRDQEEDLEQLRWNKKRWKTLKWKKSGFFSPSDVSKIERQNSYLPSFIPLSLFFPINHVFLDNFSWTVERYSHSAGTTGSGTAPSHSSRIDRAFYSRMCWTLVLCWMSTNLDYHRRQQTLSLWEYLHNTLKIKLACPETM